MRDYGLLETLGRQQVSCIAFYWIKFDTAYPPSLLSPRRNDQGSSDDAKLAIRESVLERDGRSQELDSRGARRFLRYFAGQFRSFRLGDNVLEAKLSEIQPDGFVLNYFDNSTSFTDSASSALLAATTYRLAVLDTNFDNQALLSSAAAIRAAVYKKINTETGWLSGAVVSGPS